MEHEQLTHAENAAHVQGAADFIVRLYGVRGAELITRGYTPHSNEDVTFWTRWGRPGERGDSLVECHHCGHELRSTTAMRKHVMRKHRPAA